MQVNQDAKPYDSINVTPMLDLAYVLLVVFILMTTASVQGMHITMPKPSNKPSTEKHDLKIVQVMPDGGVLLNGVGVSLAELEAQLGRRQGARRADVRRHQGRRAHAVRQRHRCHRPVQQTAGQHGPRDEPDRHMSSRNLKLLVAAACLLLGLGVWWAVKNIKTDSPKRQIAKISILPDTPPPPPPPKDEKKPEPPKDEPKTVMREEQIKQVEAPKPAESIKMEGAAGDGPSAFSAGSVAKDYAGGAPTTGATGGPAGAASERAAERFYANTVRQMLQGEIEKHLKGDAEQLVATFAVQIDKDGGIARFDLIPSGNDANDNALRAALDETRRLFKLPPPPALAAAQPMRFHLSVRPQA